MPIEFNRRLFLKQAGWSALAVPLSALAQSGQPTMRPADIELTAARNDLLNIVNYERRLAGVGTLKLDELACNVAQKHALEMAEYDFLNHWGLDGRKPYHRYSFAGGTDATSENDGSSDHSTPLSSDEIQANLTLLHKSMHGEKPPDDGHRKTILAPQNTHVGFGIANRDLRLRLCELYVARYVDIDPYAVNASPLSTFVFSGQLLDLKYSLQGIDVFYEALPAPVKLSWLRTPRPYGLPDERETLYLKLPPDRRYDDGSRGTIEIGARGRFRVPVTLTRKEPGIYTVVVWIQRGEKEEPFPSTHVCIRAE